LNLVAQLHLSNTLRLQNALRNRNFFHFTQLHHAKRDLADSLLEGTDTAHTLSADELIDLLRNR